MLGVLLFVASYDSFRNVQASYDRTYVRTHFADWTVTGGDPDAIAAAVRGAAGVEAVATRTQADQPMRIGDTKLVGRVVGMDSTVKMISTAADNALSNCDSVLAHNSTPIR